ncbi:MAG: hypothetical protein IPM52_07910 [Bacteroidetes bacterium]|nr:hypothetical protein [Bacteroidota bacterium]
MEKYPVQVLLAFAQTFDDPEGKFLNWLLHNGFPELAASAVPFVEARMLSTGL